MPGAMPPPENSTSLNAAPPASSRPSHTRYWVIVFAVALAILQYVDRVCLSQVAQLISRDLSLNKWQMGWVFSAFTLAYALFEIPAGYLGDRIGPRKVLLRIVLWWSFFTVATGWMWNWASLLVTRFLFGAGEAGAFPNLTKVFHAGLPLHERTQAQGGMCMGGRLPHPAQSLPSLAAAARAHAGARRYVDERAARRRLHARAGVPLPPIRYLADGLPALRRTR